MLKLPVKPKIDLAFKKIFSENEQILKALIAVILNIPIESIKNMQLGNTEILPQNLDSNFCRLDLKVTMDNRIIDIEIQLSNQGNFQNRALYYWSKLFSGSLDKGSRFRELPEAIVISFIDFDLFSCSSYHSHFVLKEVTRNELLTDKLSIHFFELNKLPREVDKNNQLESWLKLIGAETYEELLDLEGSEFSEFKEALTYVKNLNSDDKFKARLDMYEDALLNERSALSYAEDKGMEIERDRMINSMKKSGLDEATIRKVLDFREEGN